MSDKFESEDDVDSVEDDGISGEENGNRHNGEGGNSNEGLFQNTTFPDPLSLVDPSANLDAVLTAKSIGEAIQILCPSLPGIRILLQSI